MSAFMSLCTGLITCALGACAGVEPDAGPAPDPAPADEVAAGCAVPEGYEVLDTGHLVQGDIIAGTLDELGAACAAGRRWVGAGEAASGTRGIGVSSASLRWPNGRVPYAIDPALPQQDRVTRAIADWVDKTSIALVPKQSWDADYVYFTNGSRCASAVGRRGGRQDLLVSTGKTPATIVGTSISKSDEVFTWFSDGMVSAGTSDDLDATRVQYAYSLPPGYTPSMIRGIGIAKQDSDHVYVWYSNGMVSAGTSEQLDAYLAPRPFSLPPGKTAADLAEVDISRSDNVYAWYTDGTVSIGTSTNLDAVQAPSSYTTAPGQSFSSIRGIGITGSDDVYAWYSSGKASAGHSNNLDAIRPLYPFSTPDDCDVSDVIHELGHAVGLQHEQARCDRDSFVRIFSSNIASGASGQFAQLCNADNESLGDYNLTSVMHAASMAFSRNDSPTILGLVASGQPVSGSLVAEMSISSASRVYTWWRDRTVTVGTESDLELYRARYRYELPSGYAPADLAGIGIAKDASDRVYAFYRDGKRSIGSSDDLSSSAAPATYALPSGYSPGDIVAIDIGDHDRVYAWYADGRMSIGTSVDLDAYAAPAPYTLAPGVTVNDVLGIGIAPNNQVYAWYATGSASGGTATNLDAQHPLFGFRSRLATIAPSTALNSGDVAAVEEMY